MFELSIRNLRKAAPRTHRLSTSRWIQFSCSVMRHGARVVDLPMYCNLIQTCCNAIQTLLQLNSNNSTSCEFGRYFAVGGLGRSRAV